MVAILNAILNLMFYPIWRAVYETKNVFEDCSQFDDDEIKISIISDWCGGHGPGECLHRWMCDNEV